MCVISVGYSDHAVHVLFPSSERANAPPLEKQSSLSDEESDPEEDKAPAPPASFASRPSLSLTASSLLLSVNAAVDVAIRSIDEHDTPDASAGLHARTMSESTVGNHSESSTSDLRSASGSLERRE